ncbi:hypothetical protein QBC38DRAFT_486908 [Podospora fimiseda]|uniref:Uncharacterized protein n=1 Tax=Podospora fimiseda TaxID=252190 RepID=A0AAN7BIA7_9PEZI|nr:hypothetical protein QBC38DRAFT_486908 [Podospora fimiseda]
MAPIRDGNQVIRQVVERKYYKRKRQELLESLESLQVEGETADPVVAVEDYRLSGPIEEHMNRKSTGYYGYGRRHGHTEDDFTLQHLNLFDSERHFQQFEVVRILCREATNGLRTIVFFEGQTSNLFHLVQQLSSLEKRYMEIMEPNRFEKILNEDDKKLISSVFSMSISWSPPIEILQQIATLIDDLIKQQPQQKRLRLTLRLIKHWLDIRSVTEWSFACELYSRSPLHSQTSTFYQKIKPTLEDAFHRYKLSWSIDRSIVTKLFDLNKGFYLNPDRTVWNAYRGPTVVKSQDGSWLYEWEMDSTAVEWDKDGKAKSTVQHMKVLHCIVREKEGNIRIQAPEDAAYVLME